MQRNIMKTYDMAYIALFTVVIVLCSWISIPTAVPFTMQTFGVFAAVGILGGQRGTLSVLVYMILGALGMPVFSGMKGGIGALFGTTGGFVFGFLFSALLMWAAEYVFGRKKSVFLLSMLAGLVVCYTIGTWWFLRVYGRESGTLSVAAALGWCVVPYLIPDILKIALAYVLSGKMRKYIYSIKTE